MNPVDSTTGPKTDNFHQVPHNPSYGMDNPAVPTSTTNMNVSAHVLEDKTNGNTSTLNVSSSSSELSSNLKDTGNISLNKNMASSPSRFTDLNTSSMITEDGGESSTFHSCSESVDGDLEFSNMSSPGTIGGDEENSTDTTLEGIEPDSSLTSGPRSQASFKNENNNGDDVYGHENNGLDEDEEEAPVISASLIVNLSSNSENQSAFNISSFTSSTSGTEVPAADSTSFSSPINNSSSGASTPKYNASPSASPMSSARSAPPDLSHFEDKKKDMLKMPLLSSTPVSTPNKNGHKQEEIESRGVQNSGKKPYNVTFAENLTQYQSEDVNSTNNESPRPNETMDMDVVSTSNAEELAAKVTIRPKRRTADDVVHGSVSSSNADFSPKVIATPPLPPDNFDAAAEAAADNEVKEINSNFLLPDTVTELVAENGVKVYLVGTAHFSERSQQDVIQVILAYS